MVLFYRRVYARMVQQNVIGVPRDPFTQIASGASTIEATELTIAHEVVGVGRAVGAIISRPDESPVGDVHPGSPNPPMGNRKDSAFVSSDSVLTGPVVTADIVGKFVGRVHGIVSVGPEATS